MRFRWRFCYYGQIRHFFYFSLCLLLPCLAVELLSFWAASLFWTFPSNSSPNSTRILVVADPQLIGFRNEPKWIGWFSRWDSDRYLSRGYSHVIAAVKPDLEVYLGDLFDEGVLLTDQPFNEQIKRFHRLFPIEGVKNRIYLPGDNDIGGEMEPVYANLLERFEQQFPPYFSNANSDLLKDLIIYKTNPLNSAQFNGVYGNSENNGEDNSNLSIRILLSHWPVLPRATSRVEQELRKINIVLSGHDHTMALYMQWRNPLAFQRTASASDIDDVRWTISMDNPATLPMIEFKVPTCSYRMGVQAMGYGMLVLTPFPENRTALVQFTVLWLPSRFTQFLFYGFLLIGFPIAWTLFKWIWRKFGRHKVADRYSTLRGRKVLKSKRKRDEQRKNSKNWFGTGGGGSAGEAGGKYARFDFDV